MTYLAMFSMTIALMAFPEVIPLSEDVLPPSNDSKVPATPVINCRLPNDVVPISYKMQLTPRLLESDFSFDGVSEIVVNVTKATAEIVLHAKNLEIKKASVKQDQGDAVTAETAINTTTDFLTLTVPKTLKIGNAVINLEFKGALKENLVGFHRRSYTDGDGKKVWLATTSFQPIYARQAFPCFDEPALKATFEISIKHSSNLKALSNMHAIDDHVDDADSTQIVTTFAKTPVMSTYVVAFTVSDYEMLSNDDSTFNIWARKSVIQNCRFALEHGEKELKILEDYTGITQAASGFTRMDSIVIPNQGSEAMENWGFITYGENELLVEPNVTTTGNIEYVASIMSHEFAHQWFGNLVTPKWWKYLWLSEGFATYFQYFITDKVLPSWRLQDLHVVQDLQGSAFIIDAFNSSHAMNVEVNSQKEVTSIFDGISYSKAGSVVRMMSHVVGEENFQKALRVYLEAKKYSTATSDDLFAEFKKVYTPSDGLDFKAILDNWANTPGFPVITVTWPYDNQTALVTQERYLYKPDDSQNQTYYVPINYATKSDRDFHNTTVTGWVKPTDKSTEINGMFKKDEWIIFNKQHFGYYRVNYDEENWRLIMEALKANCTEIHVLNRAQLIDDVFNLARIGKVKYSIAFDLGEYLKQELDCIPWHRALSGFLFLHNMLTNLPVHSSFAKYVSELTDDLLKTITMNESPEDDHLTKYLRVNLVNCICTLGLHDCHKTAHTKVSKWLENSKENRLSPDLKSFILCGAIRIADQATWDKLLEKYMQERDSDLLSALGCSLNEDILNGFLVKIIEENSNVTASNDTLAATYKNGHKGIDVALDFVIENAEKLVNLAGGITDYLEAHIANIGSKLTLKEQLDKLKAFGETNKKWESAVTAGIRNAEENLRWLDTYGKEIVDYFNKKTPEHSDPANAVLPSA